MPTLPKLTDAAYPLYTFALLMGSDNSYWRYLGVSAMTAWAFDLARYIEYLNHIQECPSCAARAKLASFIAERTPQESL